MDRRNQRNDFRTSASFLSLTLAVVAALVFGAGCESAARSRFINDERSVLSGSQRSRLYAFQSSLLKDMDVEVVIDIPELSPPDIDRAAHEVFQARRIGSRSSAARGVLFLVDVEGRKVRMEIGSHLEHVFTDAFVSRIERDQMVPFFNDGRAGEGIEATLELMVTQVREAIASGDYYPGQEKDVQSYSAGAGARVTAPDGTPRSAVRTGGINQDFPAQPSPELALATYVEVLRQRVQDPSLAVYTPATRRLLASRLVTAAQQAGELRDLRRVAGQARFVAQDSLAVVLFDSSRESSPYFFRLGNEGWMIDLAAMSETIGFDLKNRWFLRHRGSEFEFAL